MRVVLSFNGKKVIVPVENEGTTILDLAATAKKSFMNMLEMRDIIVKSLSLFGDLLLRWEDKVCQVVENMEEIVVDFVDGGEDIKSDIILISDESAKNVALTANVDNDDIVELNFDVQPPTNQIASSILKAEPTISSVYSYSSSHSETQPIKKRRCFSLCGGCARRVKAARRSYCILCCQCGFWWHQRCTKLKTRFIKDLVNRDEQWLCRICRPDTTIANCNSFSDSISTTRELNLNVESFYSLRTAGADTNKHNKLSGSAQIQNLNTKAKTKRRRKRRSTTNLPSYSKTIMNRMSEGGVVTRACSRLSFTTGQ